MATRVVKIAAVQAAAEACANEAAFANKVDRLVGVARDMGAEIVVFPEGISFWVEFARMSLRAGETRDRVGVEYVDAKSFRSVAERLSDWFLKRVRFNFIGEFLTQTRMSKIIRRAMSAAAKRHGVIVVGGSEYIRKLDGMYHISPVFAKDGSLAGEVWKHNLLPVETAFGIKCGPLPAPVKVDDIVLGVAICNDVNYSEVCIRLRDQGAQLVVVPSAGWRPFPGYPWDDAKDMPQIQRATETGLVHVRPYQCGWLFPGMYFDGRTSVVYPDGTIIRARSVSSEEVLIVDVPVG